MSIIRSIVYIGVTQLQPIAGISNPQTTLSFSCEILLKIFVVLLLAVSKRHFTFCSWHFYHTHSSMARLLKTQPSTMVKRMVCGYSVKLSPSSFSCFTFSRKSMKRNGEIQAQYGRFPELYRKIFITLAFFIFKKRFG